MSYYLIWNLKGRVGVGLLREPPSCVRRGEEVFHPMEGYLGDVDYLRDRSGMLVGFAYIIGEPTAPERQLIASIASGLPVLQDKEGVLSIHVASTNDVEFHHEIVQAIGTSIFKSDVGGIVLAVPANDTENYGFKLIPLRTGRDGAVLLN